MGKVEKFDFSNYDIGGTGAAANDGKLTGEEAQKARADGWTIWDGFSKKNGEPVSVNSRENSNNAKEKMLEKKFVGLPKWAEDIIRGQDSTLVNGKPIDDVIADLTGENDSKLTSEQKEARTKLNQKQSSIGMTYAEAKAKVAKILQEYGHCYDEVEASDESQSGENDYTFAIFMLPQKTKVFNPDKLPEPARTEYKEAMAAMTEIENANPELAEKGGIKVNPIKVEPVRHSMLDNLTPSEIEGLGFKPAAKPEPTETQKSAREKLNEKVSSLGMSYKDAKTTIESITNMYKNNPEYQSEFQCEQPKYIKLHYTPIKAFDPYKLKGADKEVYFKALSAIQEIETTNYALLIQAGLTPTGQPERPDKINELLY